MSAEETPAPRFRIGVNYWPAASAMGWWSHFDPAEVKTDFERTAASGFDSVRLFLTWEDFQPTASRVDAEMVRRLVETMDLARAAGLDVMPTLFTGHMSGVNWIPPWALGGDAGDPRFRVVSAGQVSSQPLGNWFTDESILRAQVTLAGELAGALAGHPALWAWDLGNENSNCVVPPDRAHARAWLQRLTGALRGADAGARITIGLHMEDLEQDRKLGPREAADHCDFLTMHGYPGYASFTEGPTDERLLPFLMRITRWLGGGAEVLFSELGVPSYRAGTHTGERARAGSRIALVAEADAARYLERSFEALRAAGSTGAMVWCHSDYAPPLWSKPPFDLAHHERSFGVFRADGSPKPAAESVQAYARAAPSREDPASPDDGAWLDIEADEYWAAPEDQLARLFRRYGAVTKEAAAAAGATEDAPPAAPRAP